MEGLLKFGHVGDDAVRPVFFGGVGIDGGAEALGFVFRVAAPALSVTDEEALLGREVVERIKLLILGVLFPRHVGEQEAAEIGDIFTECQFPVDLDVIDDGVAGVLG